MEIIRWGILLVLILPVPFILGFIPVKHMDRLQRTPAMTYVCGWFVSFFLFELTAVPFILLEWSFTKLVAVYTGIVAAALVVSLGYGRQLWSAYLDDVRGMWDMPRSVKLGWAVFFLIVAFQMAYAVLYEYYDGDDAYYIAVSVFADRFDTMYLRDAYSGYICPLDTRHAFSPMPICSRLLWNRKAYRPVFMILTAVWFMYGNISLYTTETFAMTRTWQGKGVMAGMVLPALFLALLYLAQKSVSQGMWLLYICVCVSSVLATSVSFMVVPTITAVAAVMLGIRKRSAKFAAELFLCCAPCLLLAVCYMIIK